MRTTIDLPDELYRQIKARAATRGVKLKEFVAEALRAALFESGAGGEVRETETEYQSEVLELADDCTLPLIEGETTDRLRSMSGEALEKILTDEDVADALLPGGR